MKKKLMICCMAIMSGMSMHAQEKTVTLHNSYETTNGHRHEVPTVTYDKDNVSIRTDSAAYNVHIIIKDVSGNIIYNKNEVITPAKYALDIPEEYQNDKFTIDIYFKEKYLYGYFE